MIYRLLIKLIGHINKSLVHKFAYLYSYLFCKFCHLLPIKFQLPHTPVDVMGLSFANPVGLAAGFDRQGKFLRYSGITGFGFVEIGTINIDPNYQAIEFIHNLEIAEKHTDGNYRQLWGLNLGSLNNTLDEKSVADYTKGMELFWCHVDYLVINLSRPGSPVRELQPDLKQLGQFFNAIKQHHHQLAKVKGHHVPMVVKLAIDQNNQAAAKELLLLIKQHHFDGVIIAFENWPDTKDSIAYLHTIKAIVGTLPVIVVGGIRTMTDARQMLDAGASLVQLYTSFVQYGPLKTRRAIANLNSLK